MAKLLKPLVIVILLLSLASLVLGVLLFSRRVELKDRTQKLEQGVVKIAQNLRVENFDAERVKLVDSMQQPLGDVATFAENQYTALQDTKADLDRNRQVLAQTQSDLDTTKQDLTSAQNQVDNLRGDLETKEVELAQASGRVEQLEQDKASLQTQVDGVNDKLVQCEDATRDLQDKMATLENALQSVEPISSDVKGLSGRVLIVNPYWNFVILDVGLKSGLKANAEMLVHRHDKLVGRVRISSAKEQMSIAEILTDWEQSPIREGDYVLF